MLTNANHFDPSKLLRNAKVYNEKLNIKINDKRNYN